MNDRLKHLFDQHAIQEREQAKASQEMLDQARWLFNRHFPVEPQRQQEPAYNLGRPRLVKRKAKEKP